MSRRLLYAVATVTALGLAGHLAADEPDATPVEPEARFVSLVQDRSDAASWWALTASGDLLKYNPKVKPRFYYVGNYATGEENPKPAPYIRLELSESSR